MRWQTTDTGVVLSTLLSLAMCSGRRRNHPGEECHARRSQYLMNGTRTNENDTHYNFAYLDEQTKRAIRRALLKALSVPGYQAAFCGREMPLACGWGAGAIQVTASVIGPDDILKVIDQGADDSLNAVSIRRFFETVADLASTEKTEEATIIQTRHLAPEAPLKEEQILVYQVAQAGRLHDIGPQEPEIRKLHACVECDTPPVPLSGDIGRFGRIARTWEYPAIVNRGHLLPPSPSQNSMNRKMDMNPGIQLFGTDQERRIYAVPPYTPFETLDIDDDPLELAPSKHSCSLCGSTTSHLDEIITDVRCSRIFICSDTDSCITRQLAAAGEPKAVAEKVCP